MVGVLFFLGGDGARTSSDSVGSAAMTFTLKVPQPATLNSMKSSYCSRLIGRNVTSTGTLMPGDSLIVSGNSISKYLVRGSLYLSLSALVLTFLSTNDRTYVPPGSHIFHRRTSAQSRPQTCARSYRALSILGPNVSYIDERSRSLVEGGPPIVTAAPRPMTPRAPARCLSEVLGGPKRPRRASRTPRAPATRVRCDPSPAASPAPCIR